MPLAGGVGVRCALDSLPELVVNVPEFSQLILCASASMTQSALLPLWAWSASKRKRAACAFAARQTKTKIIALFTLCDLFLVKIKPITRISPCKGGIATITVAEAQSLTARVVGFSLFLANEQENLHLRYDAPGWGAGRRYLVFERRQDSYCRAPR